MKIKILSEFEYQTFPITEDMIEVSEEDLKNIHISKRFDVERKCVIDYDNSDILLKQKDRMRMSEIKIRLNELSQDFVQVQVGANFNDLEQRKAEFQSLHNELRVLLGKEPRKYTST